MEQAIRRVARWCARPPAVVAVWVIVPGPVAVKVVMMAVGVVRLEPRRSTGVGAADVAAAVVGVAAGVTTGASGATLPVGVTAVDAKETVESIWPGIFATAVNV